jgi:hypothetical protein
MDVLILPMTEVTAPAMSSGRLVIQGQKAPISVTHSLPKMSVAAMMEMARADFALEQPNLRSTSGNRVQYMISAKKQTSVPMAMLTYTGSRSRRRSKKSATLVQSLENL